MEEFTKEIIRVIKGIPKGKVATYGQVSVMAGKPLGARQVAWVLHSLSKKEGLPWQRVIGSGGKISLPKGAGYEKQRDLLQKEGVEISEKGKVDLSRYLWKGE